MRSFLIAFTALTLAAAGVADAKVAIIVDKDSQQMTVSIDGVERYHWPVSSGLPSYETPNGCFRAFRMEEDHYSKEFDDAPMPHSIFFTKIGHAIHGTDFANRLGSPASHGCVRLSRANAATLFALVQRTGRAQYHGDADRLLAGRARPQSRAAPTPRSRAARLRRTTTSNMTLPAIPSRSRRSSAQRRRRRRRLYLSAGRRQFDRAALSLRQAAAASTREAYRQQQYYYDNRGYYQQAPQGYYQQRQYYQPRGFTTSTDA